MINNTRYPVRLKLIDCESRTIVQAPMSCQYFALNYVWGPSRFTDSGDMPILLGNHFGLLESVPRVVEDAIIVTRRLGWRYLWVDRYCINQDDKEEKHDQIKEMDKIYRNAIVTIIAAAGNDASFGLPGVGATYRKAQPFANVRGKLLITTPCGPEGLIRKSR